MKTFIPSRAYASNRNNPIFLFIALFIIAFVCFILYASFLGLYLAFSASALLGIIVLIVEPAPLVIGLWSIFFGVNLAAKWMLALS
jgi:hypothetical protein